MVLCHTYAGATSLHKLLINSTIGISPYNRFKTPQSLASAVNQSQSHTGVLWKLASSMFITPLPMKIGLWHSHMVHSRTMMFFRMIPILLGHYIYQSDANKVEVCTTCAQGKLIQQPTQWKLPTELPPKLHRLHGDICKPIIPASGPFRYFMVLVDATSIHFEVSLLSSRNVVFAKLLTMLIKFRIHYSDFLVKTLRMNNAKELRFQHFEDCCVATSIELIYSVPYKHSQNGLAEAFIKKI